MGDVMRTIVVGLSRSRSFALPSWSRPGSFLFHSLPNLVWGVATMYSDDERTVRATATAQTTNTGVPTKMSGAAIHRVEKSEKMDPKWVEKTGENRKR